MDLHNPYAEAMWGHWSLWNGCDLSDAGRHFASALASGRQRDFVRRMQLSALLNCSDDEPDNEIIRALNAMRKEQGSVDQYTRDHVLFIYYTKIVPPRPETTPFINAVPPGEHVATFRWLFSRKPPPSTMKRLQTIAWSVRRLQTPMFTPHSGRPLQRAFSAFLPILKMKL